MTFFLQIFVILALSRACGWLVQRFLRQPQVIGEMIAGVMLGPSLLGALAPRFQQLLFAPDSRHALDVVAQLGIALYMFLVGLGFRGDRFKSDVRGAVVVALSGILVPFAVAIAAAPVLLRMPDLFGADVSRLGATLFLGAAIAITAFPVLARIIEDRGLAGSPIATLALAAAAIGDAVAWCVLAVVLAILGVGSDAIVVVLGGGAVFAAALIVFGRRLLARLGRLAEREHAAGRALGPVVLGASLMLCMLAAYVSDAIGLHPVFGAFLAGTAMPRGVLVARLRALLEPFTVAFLVPVFFAYSGLNTRLTLVSTADLLAITVGIMLASIFAKFVACWAAARLAGQTNPRSLALGALMNARGLTELVIADIGLEAGVIGPALFSMLVLMAIVTTLMAAPLFELVYGRAARARGEIPVAGDEPA